MREPGPKLSTRLQIDGLLQLITGLLVPQAAGSAVMRDSEDLRLSRSAKRQNRGHALR
jgi:hypothetical protein